MSGSATEFVSVCQAISGSNVKSCYVDVFFIGVFLVSFQYKRGREM